MDQGSAVIFLNGPKDQLEFSMNGVFGRTFSKFDGFHSIPIDKGVNFLSYRVHSSSEGAFTTLIFYPQREPKVFILDWCPRDELYKLKQQVLEIILDKFLEYPGLISYERFMGQEPEASLLWSKFVEFIDHDSVKTVFSESKLSDELFQVTPMMESHHSLLKELDSSNASSSGPALKFLKIPSLKEYGKLIGAIGADSNKITQCAMDKSPIFHYLKKDFKSIFAQLQLSFLLLVFAQNFEGFEQWIDIVALLLQSSELALKHVTDYKTFLLIIEDHFEMCPEDFFSGLMNENKLFKLLKEFFIRKGGVFDEFKSFYELKFGWKFSEQEEEEEEEEEDGPLIVTE